MKYLVVLSVIAAVASAGLLKPTPVSDEMHQVAEIIAAINSPSTDPATAAALEQLLLETLGVGPAEAPISVGPALIDFPLPDGGAVTAESESPALLPAPVLVDSAPAAAATPLVQIILNINQASSAAAPIAPAPVETPVIDVHPVQVVEEAVNEESFVPSPVVVVDAAPTPVQVVDTVPIPVQVVDVPVPEVEPIQIGTPIVPIPVVTLPDILN